MDEDVTVISHEKLEEDITVISPEKRRDENETITTKVHLDKTGGNIINFKRDLKFEIEMEEDGESEFFLQEKMDEDVAVISQEKFEEDITVISQEKLDEDITVISQENIDNDITVISHEKRDVTIIPIIKKETEKSKKDKSTNLLKEEFEVEAILDYEATVSFTLLFHKSCQYSKYVHFVNLLSETWKVFGEMEELGRVQQYLGANTELDGLQRKIERILHQKGCRKRSCF